MTVFVSEDQEVAQYFLLSHLIGEAAISKVENANSVFDEEVRKFGSGEKLGSVGNLSPLSLREFEHLTQHVPSSSPGEAIKLGVFGCGVRIEQPLRPYIGVCCRDLHSFEIIKAHLPERLNFDIRPIQSGGVVLAANLGGVGVKSTGGVCSGTLGGWIEDATSNKYYGFSANHVLCNFNRLGRNTEVKDISASKDAVIGYVEDFVRIRKFQRGLTSTTSNRADVAWCLPSKSCSPSREIRHIASPPAGIYDIDYDVSIGKRVDVQLVGKVSDLMTGEAVGLNKIFVEDTFDSNTDYAFRDQLILELDKVSQGDSGSLILTRKENKIGGLLIAVDSLRPGVAYASPWGDVLKCSNLQLNY